MAPSAFIPYYLRNPALDASARAGDPSLPTIPSALTGTRADAAWDAEQLGLISPATASDLNKLPAGHEVPALSAYIRNPKDTLRTFESFPLTQAQ